MTRLRFSIAAVSLCLCTQVCADTDNQHGNVWLAGEIVESACTIDLDSLDQTIDMGIIPLSTMRKFGESDPKHFSIDLIECRWEELSQNNFQGFDITFTGNTNNKYFLVNGDAKGVVLQLNDEFGAQIIPGQKNVFQGNTSEEIRNNYSFKLISNGEPLKAGSYYSLVNFSISYN